MVTLCSTVLRSLLLLTSAATLASALGDQCTVAHYLAAGETRPFSFRSGSQFVADLRCVFSFSGPTDQQLTLTVSDLDLAPPTGSKGKSSCVDDILTVYDLVDGELQPVGSYCGNNASNSQEIIMTTNIAVATFVSHERATTRSFTITISATQGHKQHEQQNETTTEIEEGQTEEGEEGEEDNGEDEEGDDEGDEENDEGEEEDDDDDDDQGGGTKMQQTASKRPRKISSRSSAHHRNHRSLNLRH